MINKYLIGKILKSQLIEVHDKAFLYTIITDLGMLFKLTIIYNYDHPIFEAHHTDYYAQSLSELGL